MRKIGSAKAAERSSVRYVGNASYPYRDEDVRQLRQDEAARRLPSAGARLADLV
jgi:hypothetical protein